MDKLFADRITDVPKSFIREILKSTMNPNVISFAGGLPNRELFPVEEIKQASIETIDLYGAEVLQYSTSEGLLALREWISSRYKQKLGMDVPVDNILITSGSQQGLDLIGKTLINDGDKLIIEEPGYLGAIQAMSLYRPKFLPVPLHFDGIDINTLKEVLENDRIKAFYSVPNFQNPSGISHTNQNRDKVAELLRSHKLYFIEDNPYGELQFSGPDNSSYYTRIPDQTILLGSFSKTFVPSFRIGWIVAPNDLMEKLIIAKQASDLHTNYFAQRVLYQYLCNNSIDAHIEQIKARYSKQKNAMIQAIDRYFPKEVSCSNPDGGMFLWAILPKGISAKALFAEAIKEDVIFVPGDPFYTNKENVNTMRLNFSCVDEKSIEIGIKKLSEVIKRAI